MTPISELADGAVRPCYPDDVRALSAAPWIVAIAIASSTACQDATQFKLVLTTDIPCTSLRSVAINAAGSVTDAQTQIADRVVNATTENCRQLSPDVAELGDLFLVPGQNKPSDTEGAVVVRVGVEKVDARECMPPLYRGCVVAKRTFRYLPHTSVNLPIKLSRECLDLPCSSDLTCIAKDKCVSTDYLTIPAAPDAGISTPSRVRETAFTCAVQGRGALFCKDFEDGVSPPTGMLRTEENGGALYVESNSVQGETALVAEMANVSSLATASVQDLAVAARFFMALDIELVPSVGPAVDPATYKEVARIRRTSADTQTSVLIRFGEGKLLFSRESNAADSVSFGVTPGWHRMSVEKTATGVILSVDGLTKPANWSLPSPFGFRVGLPSGGSKHKVRYDNILVTNLQ